MQGSSVAALASIASTAASAQSSATASEPRLSSFHRGAAAALLALQLALRIPLAARQRFNSDEPQHFRVARDWSCDLLPYRDLWAAWAMIPLAASSLGAIYRIGTALYSPRISAWSAAHTLDARRGDGQGQVPAGSLDGRSMTGPREVDVGDHVVGWRRARPAAGASVGRCSGAWNVAVHSVGVEMSGRRFEALEHRRSFLDADGWREISVG
jgi:hypothetical protein